MEDIQEDEVDIAQKEREKTATELEEKLKRQKELRDAAKNKESEEDSNE